VIVRLLAALAFGWAIVALWLAVYEQWQAAALMAAMSLTAWIFIATILFERATRGG
jgi:hypothetical protein